jgi:hypothetical protein
VDRLIVTPTADMQPSAPGLVRSYDAGPAGLAVRLTAEVTPPAAAHLDQQRAWVTANIEGRLVAFQAIMHRINSTSLDATGITAPVMEHRRGQLRATTRLPVKLRFAVLSGRKTRTLIAGHTIDLSRGGCRVKLPSQDNRTSLPSVGTLAEITLDMGSHSIVQTCDVLRVDPVASQAVLQFLDTAVRDSDAIERHVLSLLVT